MADPVITRQAEQTAKATARGVGRVMGGMFSLFKAWRQQKGFQAIEQERLEVDDPTAKLTAGASASEATPQPESQPVPATEAGPKPRLVPQPKPVEAPALQQTHRWKPAAVLPENTEVAVHNPALLLSHRQQPRPTYQRRTNEGISTFSDRGATYQSQHLNGREINIGAALGRTVSSVDAKAKQTFARAVQQSFGATPLLDISGSNPQAQQRVAGILNQGGFDTLRRSQSAPKLAAENKWNSPEFTATPVPQPTAQTLPQPTMTARPVPRPTAGVVVDDRPIFSPPRLR